MLTIKLDSNVSLTEATETREETPYVRGTVVEAKAGFEAAKTMRVRIYGDNDPQILEHVGQFVDVDAEFTAMIETDTGKKSFNLANVKINKVLPEAEAKKLQTALSQAQLSQLMASEPRKVSFAAAADAPPATQPELATADEL